MSSQYLGIDVAKAKFDVVLLDGDRSFSKTFKNTSSGFDSLCAWLKQRKACGIHVCMEATGPYWESLATHLHDSGYIVSVVNPVCIRSFAKSELRRSKTDSVDALVIARYCRSVSPSQWTPPPAHLRELQSLVRRLEALKAMRQQESNRLGMPDQYNGVVASIEAMIAAIDAQIDALEAQIRDHINNHPDLKEQKELLESIPGIGETTSAILLAEMGDVRNYRSARQLAAHAGLTPREYESGSSVHGKPCLSKIGNSRLRRALYMPAVVSKRYNPLIHQFCERLLMAGKPKMVVIAAAMRKLLHIVYGVLTSRMPSDPNFLPSRA
jgi:transposase